MYARAPIAFATRCASAVVTNDPGGTFAPTFHAVPNRNEGPERVMEIKMISRLPCNGEAGTYLLVGGDRTCSRRGGREWSGRRSSALLLSTVLRILASVRAERVGDSRTRKCERMRTFTVTFSSESGVSMANAMRITCDLEYDIGRRRCVPPPCHRKTLSRGWAAR